MQTFEEMLEKLKQLDETTLLELLRVSSEDLVERFRDVVENDQDRFEYELGQWFGDENDTEEG